MPRRTMSPLKATLLPVANSAVRHSQSGISERPRMRTRTIGRSATWHKISLSRSCVRLSSDTIVLPLKSTAPMRFSVSSGLREVVMTGHRCPVATVEITSTR